MARKSKILKSPNSYGGVVKMGNASRRRRPYIVRVTTGYDYNEKTGKTTQKYGIIGYVATREEGLIMLAKYHDQPYDLSKGNQTFREVYELWSEEKYENASNSTIAGYRAAFNACTILYEHSFRDLKTKDLQNVIDTCGKNYPTLKNIKILFNQVFAYAMKNELCAKDYSKYVDISKYSDKNPNRLTRDVFPKDKIDLLWKNCNDSYYQMILILIYTGVRIQELLDLKKEHVHLNEHYFDVVASKTESGVRKVPISDYIYPFFKKWYFSSDSEYMFHTKDNQPFKYRNYYDSYFMPIMEQIDVNLTPHCCRHTFVSLLAEANISQTYNKLIVGHKGAMSLNERVYTHIDMKELINAVNSIYYPDFIKNKEKIKTPKSKDLSR